MNTADAIEYMKAIDNKGVYKYGYKRAILHVFRGSVAHNLYMPKNLPNSIDDIDTMGVFVPEQEFYTGLASNVNNTGTIEYFVDQYDIVLYELRKFFNLAIKCNPNILILLWAHPDHYIVRTPAGNRLIEKRKLFMNRHDIYNSFSGYAYSQLKKIESGGFNGYMGEKRKELVMRYGYDIKNASHLVRLLIMGTEALNRGELNYYRTHDRELFLSIKNGVYTLEQIKDMAEYWFKKLEIAYDNSVLPEERIDAKALNYLCMEIIEEINT